MHNVLLVAVVGILFSGCISVRTYEEKLKFCRDLEKKMAGVDDEINALKERNRMLEIKNRDSILEQDNLRDELKSQAEYIKTIRGTYDELINELKDDISSGSVAVRTMGDQLVIVMEERILFESGKADLQPDGKKVIKKISNVLKEVTGHVIRVDGHTDNVPIIGALQRRYPTNWELGAHRSGTIIRQLMDQGVEPAHLMLASYSEYQPVGENDTPEGRELNRRVEITLLPVK